MATDLAAHPSLRELSLMDADLDKPPAALDALVDAALALRLRKLELSECRVCPASAVALPRLLRGDALRELHVYGNWWAPVLDAHVAPLLADALRSNRTLTSLSLVYVHLWRNADAAAVLLGALIGHPSLTHLNVSQNNISRALGAVGTLFGALVAAESPLRVLDVSSQYGDQLLGPLVDALPLNTHLRELRCKNNGMRAEFTRDRLMAALAANTSLQTLRSGCAEADAFIAARTAAMAAAAVE